MWHLRLPRLSKQDETVSSHKEKSSAGSSGSYENSDSVPVRATVSVDNGPQAKRPRLTNSAVAMDTVRNV